VSYFRYAPSFLFLHAKNIIASLDTLCPDPVQVAPGLRFAHNLNMLTPSEQLVELLDKVAPFEPEMVRIVHVLVKAAASKTKGGVGQEDSLSGNESEQPNEKAK
jgi:hypothetical protein